MKKLAFLSTAALLALGSSAFAAASENANCLGQARSTETRQPFGQAQSAFVKSINEGQTTYENYGQFLQEWKAECNAGRDTGKPN